jgi:hypothetical protein
MGMLHFKRYSVLTESSKIISKEKDMFTSDLMFIMCLEIIALTYRDTSPYTPHT